jgi:hypothetical protein
LHAPIILYDHDKVDALHADLRTPAAASDRKEGWSAPTRPSVASRVVPAHALLATTSNAANAIDLFMASHLFFTHAQPLLLYWHSSRRRCFSLVEPSLGAIHLSAHEINDKLWTSIVASYL